MASTSVSAVPVYSGPVTRTWTIALDGKLHSVNLYHNTVTGDRQL